MSENNGSSGLWSEWSKHVLAELKRNSESSQRIEEKLDSMNEQLTRNTVFIEEAKDKDMLSQVSHNTSFRNNTNKLIWKMVGVGITSAGGITALVNYLSGAFTR